MRYNPDTDRALYNEQAQEEFQAKFRAATGTPNVSEPVNPQPGPAPAATAKEWGVDWAKLQSLHYANARHSGRINRSYLACCELCHSIGVARAMNNFPEVRRLQAQLAAKIW